MTTSSSSSTRDDLEGNAKTYIVQSYPAPLLERMLQAEPSCRYLSYQYLNGGYGPHLPRCSLPVNLRKLLLVSGSFGVAVHMGKMSLYHGHYMLHTSYELTGDVDLKDYDNRTHYKIRQGLLCKCADEKRVCSQCWLLVEMARVTMQYLNEFYAKGEWGPILTVFSGGKVLIYMIIVIIFLKLTKCIEGSPLLFRKSCGTIRSI
jgi:hypothetical protein